MTPHPSLITNFNDLIPVAHAAAKAKGFWPDDNKPSWERCVMLVVSEMGEAIEADRKGARADLYEYNKEVFERLQDGDADPVTWAYGIYIKGSVEEELADIVIRLADMAGGLGLEMGPVPNAVGGEYENPDLCTYLYFAMREMTLDVNNRSDRVRYCYEFVQEISDAMKIDLWAHVNTKLAYNANRPAKHRKNY